MVTTQSYTHTLKSRSKSRNHGNRSHLNLSAISAISAGQKNTRHSDISECFEKNSKHLIVHEEIRDVVAKNAPFNFTGRKIVQVFAPSL